jgi:hypothetical protein
MRTFTSARGCVRCVCVCMSMGQTNEEIRCQSMTVPLPRRFTSMYSKPRSPLPASFTDSTGMSLQYVKYKNAPPPPLFKSTSGDANNQR